MPDLKLTIACWDYDRTRPLMDGRVKPEGITPNIQVLRPREIFPRMLQHQEFQVERVVAAARNRTGMEKLLNGCISSLGLAVFGGSGEGRGGPRGV